MRNVNGGFIAGGDGGSNRDQSKLGNGGHGLFVKDVNGTLVVSNEVTLRGGSGSTSGDNIHIESHNSAALIKYDGTNDYEFYFPNSGTTNLPTPPERTGYTFGGWYTNEALTTPVADDATATADAIYYAKWTKIETAPPTGNQSAGGEGFYIPPAAQKPEEQPQEQWANPFADVSEGDWFYENVKYVCQNGLMNGTGDGQFSPKGTTSRAMIMTILARLDGVDTSNGEIWYEKGMDWAVENGISDGADPEGNVTREQLAVMLYRFEQKKGENVAAAANLGDFSDANAVSGYAQEALHWAVSEGIINGMNDGRLAPQGQATRAQAAAMLQRYLEQ